MQKIFINGEIGYWYSEAYKDSLFFAAPEPMAIYIDSGGGSVTDGMAIAALMRQHAAQYNVEVKAIGLGFVGSIATVPLLAATRSEMDRAGFLMIHNPFADYVSGGSKELRQTAATLDTIKNTLAEIYTDKIAKNGKLKDGNREKTKQIVLQYMAAETWFSAQEALDFGLIDGICDGCDEEKKQMQQIAEQMPAEGVQRMQNLVNQYKNAPTQLKNKISQQQMDLKNFTPEQKTGVWAWLKNLFKSEGVDVTAESPAPTVETPTPIEPTEADHIAALEKSGYSVTKKADAEAKDNAAKAEVETVKNSLAEAQKAITAKDTEIVELKAKLVLGSFVNKTEDKPQDKPKDNGNKISLW